MKAAATWILGAGSIIVYAWFARDPVPLPSAGNEWAIAWTVLPSITICLVMWLAFQEQDKADYERDADTRVESAKKAAESAENRAADARLASETERSRVLAVTARANAALNAMRDAAKTEGGVPAAVQQAFERGHAHITHGSSLAPPAE